MDFGKSRTKRFSEYPKGTSSLGPGCYDIEKSEELLKSQAYARILLSKCSRFADEDKENNRRRKTLAPIAANEINLRERRRSFSRKSTVNLKRSFTAGTQTSDVDQRRKLGELQIQLSSLKKELKTKNERFRKIDEIEMELAEERVRNHDLKQALNEIKDSKNKSDMLMKKMKVLEENLEKSEKAKVIVCEKLNETRSDTFQGKKDLVIFHLNNRELKRNIRVLKDDLDYKSFIIEDKERLLSEKDDEIDCIIRERKQFREKMMTKVERSRQNLAKVVESKKRKVENIQTLKNDLKLVKEEAARQIEKVSKLEEEKEVLLKEVEKERFQNHSLEEELQSCLEDKCEVEEKLAGYEQYAEELEDEKARGEKVYRQKVDLLRRCGELEVERESLKEQVESGNKSLTDKNELVSALNLEMDVLREELTLKLKERDEEIFHLKQAFKSLEEEGENWNCDKNRMGLRIEEVEALLKKESEKYSLQSLQCSKLKEKLKIETNQKAEALNEVCKLKQEALEKKNKVQALEEEIIVLNTQVNSLLAEKSQFENDIQEMHSSLGDMTVKLTQLDVEKKKIYTERSDLVARVQQMEYVNNNVKKEKQQVIEQLEQKLFSLENQVFKSQNEQQVLKEEVVSMQQHLEDKSRENSKLFLQHQEMEKFNSEKYLCLEKKLLELEREKEILHREMNQAKTTVEKISIELQDTCSKLLEAEVIVKEKENALQGVNERLKLKDSQLEEINESLESRTKEVASLKSCIEDKDEMIVHLGEAMEKADSKYEVEKENATRSTLEKIEQISMLQHELQIEKQNFTKLHQNKTFLEDENTNLSRINEEFELQLNRAKAEVDKQVSVSGKLKNDVSKLEEQLNSQKTVVVQLQQNLESKNDEVILNKQEFNTKIESISRLFDEKLQLEKEVVEKARESLIEAQTLMEEKNTLIQRTNKEVEELGNEKSEIIKKLEITLNEKQDVEKELELKKERLKEVITRMEQYNLEIQLNGNELAQKDAQIQLLEQKELQLTTELVKTKGHLTEYEKIMQEKLEEITNWSKSEGKEELELEENRLLAFREAISREAERLAEKENQLVGHGNRKQRIKHFQNVKKENFSMKEEITRLKGILSKQHQKLMEYKIEQNRVPLSLREVK
eukprot:snap_masked-scaffold_3-processed-gene-19.25-mRNA-1 protein AED:1.00 eAED:1.00 QI:0/0/0/0/1/1/2/0/1134